MNSRPSDLILPLAVVAVVGMMVFPLPAFLIDVLLMLNIAFSLSLIIGCVYLTQPERFTALPSILLLTTVFRLGLNISTTRILLGTGEAPELVIAFGEFVVGGNIVVGVVVFLLITLVQFVVIAKGAERVAEVSARFTLDALPGKQMAVDADVRSGFITVAEARERRIELQREAKLFGALDGAMKFVKGDAIAGLLITAVNITAGLFVGVSQLKLSFADAAHRFTIFTVGDGLVSQIPALLIAVAAGIAVTRVSSSEDTFLGRELFVQVLKEPQAIKTTSILLLCLGAVPGFPMVPFLVLGGIGLVVGYRVGEERRRGSIEGETRFEPRVLSPIVLKLSKEAGVALEGRGEFSGRLQQIRSSIFDRWGVLLPDLSYEVGEESYAVLLLFRGTPIRAIKSYVDSAGLSDGIIQMVSEALEEQLPDLLDDSQTRLILEVYEPSASDLITSVIPAKLSVTQLTKLCRSLLADGIPLREFRVILQAVAEWIPAPGLLPSQFDGLLLAEVRTALRRTITLLISSPGKPLEVAVLSGRDDQLLSEALYTASPLDPFTITRLQESYGDLRERVRPQVIVTTKYARQRLSEVLRGVLGAVPVVAADEILDGVQLCQVGIVGGVDEEEMRV